MSLDTIVSTPATGRDLFAPAWSPSFPSADLVNAAASLLPGWRLPDAVNGVTLPATVVRSERVVLAKMRELYPENFIAKNRGPRDRTMIEGPRWRLMVSPGTVSVRSTDYARQARREERQRLLEQGSDGTKVLPKRDPFEGPAVITNWSSKSRARMVEVLGQLDWTPMFETGEIPAMVTLTYPGDWLAVAPNAAAARRHFKMLRSRFERAWKRRLIGAWKREFQRRGAPHFHLLMVPPTGQVNGQKFAAWLSSTWASIVGAERCADGCEGAGCCEYRRHLVAGTGVDYADGLRAKDPRAVGVYFSKHGSFAAKDYQNDAPVEWTEHGSVGRFWGVWGLDKALAGAEIHGDTGQAAARTLRRWSRAQNNVATVPVWRSRTRIDTETGEIVVRWRKSFTRKRVYRLRHGAGFVATKDGPALVAQLSRYLTDFEETRNGPRAIGNAGAGPRGFLP